jgi:CRISPR-associated protein Cmr6
VTQNRLAGPRSFDYKDRFDPKPDFARKHGLASRPDGKTTQGLFYAAYGMDEVSRGEQRHRHYVDAGSQWRIRLIASDAEFSVRRASLQERASPAQTKTIAAKKVLEQALAALWLLCAYGGAGSKSRKGFGSLQLSDDSYGEPLALAALAGLDECRSVAAEFRDEWGLSREFRLPDSPALGPSNGLPAPASIAVPWQDAWKIMDEIGFAYQAFTKMKRHDRAKVALGLPRKIHGPRDDGPMRNQSSETYRRPEWLDFPKRDRRLAPKDARHASPIHLHVSRQADGAYLIRVLAFPTKSLPNEQTSRQVLQEFIACFEREIARRAALPAPTRAEAPTFSRDRRPDDRNRTTAPRPSRSLPTITKDDLLRRLADSRLPEALFRIVRPLDSGGYEAQQLRSAPNVPAGYQGDGGRRVVAAPEGLPEGAIVLVVLEGGRDGRFQEAIGQLPGPSRPQQQRRGPQRR